MKDDTIELHVLNETYDYLYNYREPTRGEKLWTWFTESGAFLVTCGYGFGFVSAALWVGLT